jgi:hypothetical protein
VKKGPPGCASRTSNSLFLRRNMSKPALIRLRGGFELPGTVSFYAGNMLSALFVFVAPEMKCVSENYVAKQIVF